MKKLLTIIFSLTISFCFSQTKEQLIDTIIKVNRVDSDCTGIGCSESEQYKNFQKLKNQLSDKELIDLSKHENPTIRTYASKELIFSGKGNIPELLAYELQKNEMVETFEGDLMDFEPTSSIIYHEYWNKIRLDALSKSKTNSDKEREVTMQKRLNSDYTMEKLDSLIIHSNKKVYWLLYSRVFNNRKHKEKYLPQIEELAFSKNNAYAFEYLKKYYSTKYAEKFNYYITSDFINAEFNTENDVFFLHQFMEILLKTNDENYKQILMKKLEKEKNIWHDNKYWYNSTLRKHGIEIEK